MRLIILFAIAALSALALFALPQQAGTLLLLGWVGLAVGLALRRAGVTRHDLLRAALLPPLSLYQFVRAVLRFYDLPARFSGVNWFPALPLSLGLVAGALLAWLLWAVSPPLSLIILALVGLVGFVARREQVDLLVLPRALFSWKPAEERRSPLALLILLGLLCGVLLALLLWTVSPPLGLIILVLVIGVGVIAGQLDLGVYKLPQHVARRTLARLPADWPEIETLAWPRAAIEIGVVVFTALVVTRAYGNSEPYFKYSYLEAEWLTSSAYALEYGIEQYGRIPLWQPLLERGEPLVENPFAFIFNPLSSVPVLLAGAINGVKISVIVYTVFAGVGGWFMGRMLGLGPLGRVLLGLLLIGKGNMHGMIQMGYYQLGVTQAYFPWAMGSVIALIRLPRRAWPVVLTALSMTLLYFAGNLWYILPTIVGIGVIAGVYALANGRTRIDWQIVRRLAAAALLTVGLCAVTLLPLVAHFHLIGNHPPEIGSGMEVPLREMILPLYFDPNPERPLTYFDPFLNVISVGPVGDISHFYYAFTIPGWYALLIFLVPLYRPGAARRLWWVALVFFVLATIWGAGGSLLFEWLYANVRLLAQWRYVGRALAISAFWLAVLVAMRADSLWNHLVNTDWAALGVTTRLGRLVPTAAALGLSVATALAGWQVVSMWNANISSSINPTSEDHNRCITWLRRDQPGKPLSVWQGDYDYMLPFQLNRVRSWEIQADFAMLPVPNTIASAAVDLNQSLPEFGFAWTPSERAYLNQHGYRPVAASPRVGGFRCLHRKADALSYAYLTPLALAHLLLPAENNLYDRADFPSAGLTDVERVEHRDDAIAVWVKEPRLRRSILTLQERAYPGWTVTVNGQPAVLESFGGQLAVEVPSGNEPVAVLFVYRPPLVLLGGIITILTAAACSIWLLWRARRERAG
ncbi:MAG: hypothetical protein JNJ61_13120 [Anaerolineae bacterium]|nr:hypothetical protein [Anaerolineae bacterium]